MSSKVKLGIFDSGIGGLSVANFLIDRYPAVETWYLADSLFLPYGTKAEHLVKDRVAKLMRFFSSGNFTHVICACNTAYALAGDIIDGTPDLRVSNVTQALIHTLPTHINLGKSLLVATPNTIKSGIYQKYLGRIHGLDNIHISANSTLVELIEEPGDNRESIYHEILEIAHNCSFKPETVILGCTHYNWVVGEFQKVFPRAIIYDSRGAFEFSDFDQNSSGNDGKLRFFDTGQSEHLQELVENKYHRTVEHLSLEDSSLIQDINQS
mgnify:CR=1 FL=1